MPASRLDVVLLGAIQGHEHGQGPQPAGKRKADQDGQDHPLVTPAENGHRVRGADRIPVTALAEDLGAFVPIDGIIPCRSLRQA